MARPTKKLTALELQAKIKSTLKRFETEDRKEIHISAGPYLILHVYPTGKAVYYFQGKGKSCKLGDYGTLMLAEARADAQQKLKELSEAAGAKQQAPKAGARELFGDLWAEYLGTYKGTGKNNKRYMNFRAYTRHLSGLSKIAVRDMTPLKIVGILKAIQVSPNYRANIFQAVKQCLDYAVIMKQLLPFNPLRALAGTRLNPFKRTQTCGFAFLPPDELKDGVFARFEGQPLPMQALILYIALSCARLGEAQYLRWEYVIWDKKEIRLPAEIMKNGKAHTVAMTTQIAALLRRIKELSCAEDSGYVFRASPVKDNAIGRSDLQVAIKALTGGRHTIHGFRKSASTWLHEHGYREAAERILAHVVGNEIERTYDHASYFEMKLKALQAWDDWLEKHALTKTFIDLLK